MGGSAEAVTTHIKEHYRPGMSLQDALRVAVAALGSDASGTREIPVASLEAAVLDRTRSQQRKFKRLTDEHVERLLAGDETRHGDTGPTDAAGDEPVAPVNEARLMVVASTRTVIANGLRLLGVSAPERM